MRGWSYNVLYVYRRTTNDDDDDDDEADATKCLYCAELWRESVDKWIKCQGPCGEWAHTACAGVMPKEKNFVCELCHE